MSSQKKNRREMKIEIQMERFFFLAFSSVESSL